jgi:hypothetical protein
MMMMMTVTTNSGELLFSDEVQGPVFPILRAKATKQDAS